MKYNFHTRLKNKELLVGAGISLCDPSLIEIYSVCGYDWVFIDMEHSPLDALAIQHLLRALGPDCSGIIRISDQTETTIKKSLDLGPDGIIVPQVNTPEQARHIVEYARFAPLGTRGVGVSRANDYGQSLGAYLSQANTSQVLIFQAEHFRAVENIEKILDINGFNAILVGPYDLSASMGKPGQVEDPDVQAAIEEVGRACVTRDVPCGIFGASATFLKPYIQKGFRFVVAGMDVLHVASSAAQEIQELKKP